MILAKQEIIKEIKSKRIQLVPFKEKNINDASIDLTLDDTFWIFKKDYKLSLTEKTDVELLCVKKKLPIITLKPGDFILGRTLEKITLPEDICGFLSGRSRFARLGLTVDVTAFFIQPGISNHQVLEIKNLSHNELIIKPGLKIAQIILERTDGKSKYSGKYKDQ